MSRKNHKMVDGKLLQTDQRFSQLKQAQKEKIDGWFYDACRRAFLRGRTLPSPRQEPGHIACDSASLSETVVPVLGSADTVRAVLDVDSPIEGRFFDRDRDYLERLCRMLGAALLWELQ